MIVKGSDAISLANMDSVTLMNRLDSKYCLHRDQLPLLLERINGLYYHLEINDEHLHPYQTVYYDTPGDAMYKAHHNGRLNRFKVRRRTYMNGGLTFFEIKFKNNKGRTVKTRIKSKAELTGVSDEEYHFLTKHAPRFAQLLKPAMVNRFDRLTLVSKQMNERCTIDFNLSFGQDASQVALPNLVIIEVKTSGRNSSPIVKELKSMGMQPQGFSKYCVGMALTQPELKQNGFKPKLRRLRKAFINN